MTRCCLVLAPTLKDSVTSPLQQACKQPLPLWINFWILQIGMTTLNSIKQHLDNQWGQEEESLSISPWSYFTKSIVHLLLHCAVIQLTLTALRNLIKHPHPLTSCCSPLILDFPKFSSKCSSSCRTCTTHAQEKIPFPLTSVDFPEFTPFSNLKHKPTPDCTYGATKLV